jgi:hypothetical protein
MNHYPAISAVCCFKSTVFASTCKLRNNWPNSAPNFSSHARLAKGCFLGCGMYHDDFVRSGDRGQYRCGTRAELDSPVPVARSPTAHVMQGRNKSGGNVSASIDPTIGTCSPSGAFPRLHFAPSSKCEVSGMGGLCAWYTGSFHRHCA